MKSELNWGTNFRLLIWICLTVYAPIILFFILVKLMTGVPISSLTFNPVAYVDFPFYFGSLAKVGILLWTITAVVCFFSSYLLGQSASYKECATPLFFAGLATSSLLLDDFFSIHIYINDIFHGLSLLVYATHLALIGFYLFRFNFFILKTEFILLYCAIALLGISLSVDIFLYPFPFTGKDALEDGAKLLGIVTWFIYHIRLCVGTMAIAIKCTPQDRRPF
jgi:hypothetical protein